MMIMNDDDEDEDDDHLGETDGVTRPTAHINHGALCFVLPPGRGGE